MSQVASESTILWLGVQRANHSPITTRLGIGLGQHNLGTIVAKERWSKWRWHLGCRSVGIRLNDRCSMRDSDETDTKLEHTQALTRQLKQVGPATSLSGVCGPLDNVILS